MTARLQHADSEARIHGRELHFAARSAQRSRQTVTLTQTESDAIWKQRLAPALASPLGGFGHLRVEQFVDSVAHVEGQLLLMLQVSLALFGCFG